MVILVTGCAGFIGWRVTECALRGGHVVIGVDNLNDAYDTRMKEWRLKELEGKPGFTFQHEDIADRAGLDRVFTACHSTGSFDGVIHLAARAGVRQSVVDPWIYYETNVTGTLNLLEECRRHEVDRLVMASTSSLYGVRNPRPFREDANTDGPLSPYAASKKAAEALVYTYHHLHGLNATVLRYFTVYGPAGRPDMSVFRFIKWISEGQPVAVYGDGSQERDFTYVDDVAEGTLAALNLTGFDVINLGGDSPIRLSEMLRLVEELVGRKASVEYGPPAPADMPATWADIEKARRLLGWEPKTTFEEGLRRTVDWYREHRSWARELEVLQSSTGSDSTVRGGTADASTSQGTLGGLSAARKAGGAPWMRA